MTPLLSDAAIPGTVLTGRFRLDERISSGGMGEVWRGIDLDALSAGREAIVAIKVLAPELRLQRVFLARLAAEATNLASLDHPAIARFIAHGHSGELDYLVMQFVPGVALHNLAPGGATEDEPILPAGIHPKASSRGIMTYRRAANLLAQVAAALSHAHQRGIVHRDVKPANILVEPHPDGGDRAYVTDFGISFGRSSMDLTEPGRVMGTADYLAPERIKGAPSCPATDLYALGVSAFEIVTGYRPYDGPTPVAIALKHISEPPPQLPIQVPPRLRTIIMSLLAKNPDTRPQTAAQVADELTTFGSVSDSVSLTLSAPPAPATH